ncbi:thymidylate synthase [Nitratidesulfovibrio liaohensis]|uniref:thymidylate synthase n=1 Tax=Nitratidesulfovibrio liaohensis TaxID=2604158 RepID=UPI0014236EC0|nr:hypothetical protein [Nitratidesulfovibrio liaohensis]
MACDVSAYFDAVRNISESGKREGRYLEVLGFNCVSYYNINDVRRLKKVRRYAQNDEIVRGWLKSVKAYSVFRDRPQKPSYGLRIRSYNSFGCIVDQLDAVAARISEKPGYSCQSILVYSPVDLIKMVRPGYVPCVTAIDVKVRDSLLHFHILMRSLDVYSSMIFDMLWLRILQRILIAKICKRRYSLKSIKPGVLNIFCGRAYIKANCVERAKTFASILCAE